MVKAVGLEQLVVSVGNPLLPGVQKTATGYNFTISIKSDEQANLLLYKSGTTVVIREFALSADSGIGNLRSVHVEGLLPERYEYNYQIGQEVITDPVAQAVTGRKRFGQDTMNLSAHEVRGQLCQRPAVDELKKKIPYEDMILYKLHVRGFTKHESAQVKDSGTFAGLMEKIPYLKDLGVTSVALMPVYDFEEYAKRQVGNQYAFEKEPKLNYWGYTGGFYFAPKTSYCATNNPIEEVADMVKALHKEGMECLMEFYFSADISVGFILDVLRFWRLWYRVDGFHLMGRDIPIEAIVEDPLLMDVKLLYVGFDIGKIYGAKLPSARILATYNLGFQENLRCFLRGDENQVPGVMWRTKYNPRAYAVVNYMASQDGFTLKDMVSYEQRHNEANGENNRDGIICNDSQNCGVEGPTEEVSIINLRQKQMKNAIWFILLSQGAPMIYAGDERGNSQAGNNNAYCQDNEISWIDWNDTKESIMMHDFVKAAIAFRKEHRIFHAAHEIQDTDYKALGIPEVSFHGKSAWVADEASASSQLGILYCGEYVKNDDGTSDDYLYVAYNMGKRAQELALPKLPKAMKWEVIVNSSDRKGRGIYEQGIMLPDDQKNKVKVPSRTVMVLKGK